MKIQIRILKNYIDNIKITNTDKNENKTRSLLLK